MSTVKFKIAFTINAETLFTLASKLLPIDDLSIEELIERPVPTQAERLTNVLGIAPRHKPKHKYKRKPSKPMDLTVGINRIVMDALSDRLPHRAVEMKPAFKMGGYSENSVGSRLQNLERHGVVEQIGDGTWRLTEKYLPESLRSDNV